MIPVWMSNEREISMLKDPYRFRIVGEPTMSWSSALNKGFWISEMRKQRG